MKKSIIIICSIVFLAFSSVAIVYLNQGDYTLQHSEQQNTKSTDDPSSVNNSNGSNTKRFISRMFDNEPAFHLAIESRFNATISKEKLLSATSIHNLVPKGSTDGILSFADLKISKLVNEDLRMEVGNSGKLNASQLALLHSLDYSNNFSVESIVTRKNETSGEIEVESFVYYITVVPETEAFYEGSKADLINYFQKNSVNLTAGIKSEEFSPGKVRFTITKYGKIDKVEWESTSGNTAIDLKMLELLKELPGNWTPATNAKGEKVDQELILSFGSVGC